MTAALATTELLARAVPVVGGALGLGGVAVATLPARVRLRAELRRRWRTWALAAPLFLGAFLAGPRGRSGWRRGSGWSRSPSTRGWRGWAGASGRC
ncbi:phosphatidate cytidylyltransferase [Streptomyces sp. ScaeMP-6W]|uniref:hypothetical protein n=1 Tax=unclassified Streptomyces TaxID=2593676 RepID=UPI00081F6ACA|nr:hypothetical protein [Streptomyces sp. ScaeMP-6W]SCE01583.1 phosphatidate cytidylyltransferase [Streptomyces sp. ScaeMP-6W]